MKIRVIDFETATNDPDRNAICEYGFTDVFLGGDGKWRAGGLSFSHLINPGMPISPEASCIHNIVDADVDGCSPPDFAMRQLMSGMFQGDVFAAHNAEFERRLFGGGQHDWICTYKVAYALYEDAPNHKNGTLRYWLDLPVDRFIADPSHRAGPDSYVTAHLIAHMLNSGTSAQEMIRITSEPLLLRTCPIGKWKGSRWPEIDEGYLEWIMRTQDMGADIKHAAKTELDRRRKQRNFI